MKKLILILLCVISAICFAQPEQYGPYDPGAMRTGQIAKAATGTAALPAYSFGSDPDTGIYSPGANEIGFSSGGVDKLRLTSDNDFGIGTTTPKMGVSGDSRELHLVAGSGQVAGVRIETMDGQNAEFFVTPGGVNAWGLYSTSNIPFQLYTNNAERMRITAGGNMLIGTDSNDGANKLQVNGSMRLIGGAAPTAIEGAIYFNSTDKHFYGYNGTGWVQLDN